MPQFKCVLFDLDGTILNTNQLVIKSFQYALAHHLQRNVTAAELYPYFGEPLITTMRRFSPAIAEDLVKTYREYNLANHDSLVTMFPGTQQVLTSLHENGVKIGLVTSKTHFMALRGLKLFGLEELFAAVVAMEDTGNHKPHPEPILTALAKLDLSAQGVMMVGDSPFDLRCAQNAGVLSAAVGWSVHPAALLQREQPDYFLAQLTDLLTICTPGAQPCLADKNAADARFTVSGNIRNGIN